MKTTKRLLSLDFFKGLTIAAMILVNTPGDEDHVYAPLQHSKWNGCTPTDLVFPFFLFMVGVSIVYALQNKKNDKDLHPQIIWGALRRMFTLIALGLCIFLFYRFDFAHLRFPGVLQRIGVVYFISAIIYLKSTQRFRDWLLATILVTYYLLLNFVPIPDGHSANLTPEHNLAAWLDRALFSSDHMYRQTVFWDPVGLLSTWPAIATALFGVRVGELLKRNDLSAQRKCLLLMIVGFAATVSGLVADRFFPLNKQLWTSSYVLYTGGLCTIGLTISYWLIDVKGYTRYVWILVVLGTNAIGSYVLSEIMPGLINFFTIPYKGASLNGMRYFYEAAFVPVFQPFLASFFFALSFVALIWLFMLVLYQKNIIIKV